MTERATTLAAGGARQVATPDPIARDYLLLALRLDQQELGRRMIEGSVAGTLDR